MPNLKEDILKFSSNWETYLDKCQINGGNKSDEETYKLFFYEIENKFKELVDEKVYKVKTSLGSGRVTAVPWIGIFHKNITLSAKEGIYIVYLFSRNLKTCYLSMEIGSGQFEEIYGKTSKCSDRIEEARNRFRDTFSHYSPVDKETEINLKNEDDKRFTEKFGKLKSTPKFKINNYIAGSFFRTKYSFNKLFLDINFENDLRKYLKTYESIIDDPIGISYIEYLLDSVHEKNDVKQKIDLDYEIPKFIPRKHTKEINNKKDEKNTNSENRNKFNFSLPSKKVGRAGEEHVFEYEYNKLVKAGRKDLALKIVKQYEILNNFPGYDIKSFDKDGNEMYIEVKSTKSKSKSYFEISRNEVLKSKKFQDQYFIYHVVDVLKNPRITNSLSNPLSKIDKGEISMDPLIYQIKF